MRIESEEGLEFDAWSRFEKNQGPAGNFHKSIFSESDQPILFLGKAALRGHFSDDQRMGKIFSSKVDKGVEASISYSWGGKEPPKGELSVSGTLINKETGNRIDLGYTINDEGRQTVSASGKDGPDQNAVDCAGQDQR